LKSNRLICQLCTHIHTNRTTAMNNIIDTNVYI